MVQRRRVLVTLLPGWVPIDGESGAYCRDEDAEGAFQVSHIEYAGGEVPKPSCEDLVRLASDGAAGQGVHIQSTASGSCRFGMFGTAWGSAAGLEVFQIWYLSNGRDFILATYNAEALDATERAQAETMALGLVLSEPRRPWWKVWAR